MKKALVLSTALLGLGSAVAQAAQPVTIAQFAPAYVQSDRLLTPVQADLIALKAVNGGHIIRTQFDRQPLPARYSVDLTQPGFEFEVQVNAHTGVVMKVTRTTA